MGKSTFVHTVLQPVTHLPFINADESAVQRWTGQEVEHAYDASAAATAARDDALSRQRSFITETVFSHPSKIELVKQGSSAGYLRTLAFEWAYAHHYASESARGSTYQAWIHSYNHHRPHTGIGGKSPIDRVHNLNGKNT